METKIMEIAERIRGLREMLDISEAEMAEITGVSIEEYRANERGENDFSFTFMLKCAERFGIDIVELMTGENPHLSFYMVTRSGKGLPIQRRRGLEYRHLAPFIKNKLAEPFFVTAPYSEEEQNKPITYSTHAGQEFDYIIKGSLKCDLDGHIEVLNAGDSIFYDSGHRHGMIATGNGDCEFLAIVFKKDEKKK
ncbi:MAG TPA: cupin domain-containing protein [Ruminiclostridium sp.]|nr:cupin domain-containing protein [Ruminiclostridium sp.]